jgi:hypothetical protein
MHNAGANLLTGERLRDRMQEGITLAGIDRPCGGHHGVEFTVGQAKRLRVVGQFE